MLQPRQPRRRRWPWVFGTILLIGGTVTAVVRADRPPTLLMETARKAISTTHAVEAGEWAPDYVKAAQETLLAASREIDRENARFFVIRDYDAARTGALAADRIARETIGISIARRDSVQKVALEGIKEAGTMLAETREMLEYVPVDRISRGKMVRLDLARQQAKRAADEGLYRRSIELTEEVISGTEGVKVAVTILLDKYHDPIWKKWARDTIEWSRQNRSHAIIVRKLEHRCDVYFAGQLKTSFPAELGLRWMGQKVRAGDHVTPEGRYQVINKKNGSRYHRALEINYPNSEDEVRFRLGKKTGHIPRQASIGGLIEIHGNGGKGKDWTQGCVALTNGNMDKLFAMANVGTPVTIVGSYDPDGTGSLSAR
ncbi:MAG: L,D-transpeptidase [Candidatus Eisenbacteria bacterium]|nr:L,D-transpeptidase [Candidatus Eisenbacteria bacterium]